MGEERGRGERERNAFLERRQQIICASSRRTIWMFGATIWLMANRDREREREWYTLIPLFCLPLASGFTNCQSVGITVHILHCFGGASLHPLNGGGLDCILIALLTAMFALQKLMKSQPSAALIVCGMQHTAAVAMRHKLMPNSIGGGSKQPQWACYPL